MNHHKLGDMQVMMINHGRFWGPWRAWESPRKLLEVYSWPNHQWSMAISGTDLLEVPTIYKAYIRTIFWGISHKIWPDMVQYLHFRILKFPLINISEYIVILGIIMIHCTDPSKTHGCLEFLSVIAGNVVLKCGKPYFMAMLRWKMRC